MDAPDTASHHARVRVLPHIKRLDCFGDFLVRVTCPCGASRHIHPEALARIADPSVTLAALATRMRCSHCGENVAEVVAELATASSARYERASVPLLVASGSSVG